MKIAVIANLKPSEGGGFQQELFTCCLLKEHHSEYHFDFISLNDPLKSILAEKGIQSSIYCESIWKRLVEKLYNWVAVKAHRQRLHYFERFIRKLDSELVLFASPSWLAAKLGTINYILPVWDLAHLDYPEFPEMRICDEFAQREAFYHAVLPPAFGVLADSTQGRLNISRHYHINKARIRVFPVTPRREFLPQKKGQPSNPEHELLINSGIREPFVFYPAQFWQHKNHVFVLDALQILKRDFGLEMNAVFCGSNKNNHSVVENYSKQLGLNGQVKFLGFVDDAMKSMLYRHATALVMPTYFGPTNIPPLEAFAFGCPVCYTAELCKSQGLSEAAFGIDLTNPRSLAESVHAILTQTERVNQKKKRGLEMLKRFDGQEHWNVLKDLFQLFEGRRHCWHPSLKTWKIPH